MQVGDKVIMSSWNENHLGRGVCAYAGMEGTVIDISEDGSFALDCVGSTFVVPMDAVSSFGSRYQKKGVWIWLNGNHIFHKSTKVEQPKKWYQKLFK